MLCALNSRVNLIKTKRNFRPIIISFFYPYFVVFCTNEPSFSHSGLLSLSLFTFVTLKQSAPTAEAGLRVTQHLISFKSVSRTPIQVCSTMFASVLLVVCVFILIIQLISWKPKNFPPGPTVLPIVGNILSLSLQNPLNDFERVRGTLNGSANACYLLVHVHPLPRKGSLVFTQ